ncbi:phytoene desaturase family protein [Microbacterium alcoholitolerans]|uniref:phytoene desaturase family protein n=1 Tax=unclassified Microbacterium TaxID=2609290 RepID=UPI003D16FB69
MTRTVVIGGGVAGLATAALLAREGHEVELLERLDRVGGRAGSLERDGFRFDTGPSWYLMPRVFDHFFELLGTSSAEQLDLRDLSPAYRVFGEPFANLSRPEPVTVPRGGARVRDTFERLEPGAAKRLEKYLASANHATEMAERYFLYNPFTDLRSLLGRDVLGALPRLAGLLTGKLDSFVARRFQHPILRQILGYPAVFLGTSPSAAPAMYHLMSALDLDEGVQYPMGGFWELVQRIEALAIDAGAVVRTGAEVQQITTRDTGSRRRGGPRRTVEAVRWQDSGGEWHDSPADVVVSAADLHHTETRLLDEPSRSYPEAWWRRRVSGPGAVLVMLGVRGGLPNLPHHTLLFTRDWAQNFDAIFGADPAIPDPASVYVCKPSATDPDVAPAGHENLFILVPIPPGEDIGEGGPDGSGDPLIERIADAAIDQLAQWTASDDLRDRIVVRHTIGPTDFARDYHAWRGGMLGPAHTLRQSAMFRAQNASKNVAGLYYAGATTAPGVGVPMCLISAELVLKRIRGDHSPGPTTARAGVGSVR